MASSLAFTAPVAVRPSNASITNVKSLQTSRRTRYLSMTATTPSSSSGQQSTSTSSPSETVPRRAFLQTLATTTAVTAAVTTTSKPTFAASKSLLVPPPAWAQVPLPTSETIFDIDFSPLEPDHGFLVGSRGTVAETFDRGSTWQPRAFARLDADEELSYRFEVVTFLGSEGWVIGKPGLLLHTADSGKSWERIPLSPKLPGEPVSITALGPGTAEMTTNAGAVYITENNGQNWKAQVRETIDATLNRTISSGVSGASYFTGSIISVLRDTYGAYLAISSRGNFFLTWKPGQDFWIPHARETSRRIQAMGFIRNDVNQGVWMATRGGGLSFTGNKPDLESTDLLKFDKVDIRSGGYGILDVAFRPGTDEVWAAVGGGSLYKSMDGGNNWRRDNQVDKVGANIYKIKFFDKDTAFGIGANGLLLKYDPRSTGFSS